MGSPPRLKASEGFDGGRAKQVALDRAALLVLGPVQSFSLPRVVTPESTTMWYAPSTSSVTVHFVITIRTKLCEMSKPNQTKLQSADKVKSTSPLLDPPVATHCKRSRSQKTFYELGFSTFFFICKSSFPISTVIPGGETIQPTVKRPCRSFPGPN